MELVPLCLDCNSPQECVRRYRELAERTDLDVTLEVSLKGIPDSVHFHLRKRGERVGILEYTMDVRHRRSYLAIHSNRKASWIPEAIVALTARNLDCSKAIPRVN